MVGVLDIQWLEGSVDSLPVGTVVLQLAAAEFVVADFQSLSVEEGCIALQIRLVEM